MKFCTIRIDLELYDKIKRLDQTGRGKFTSGLMFIIKEYFKDER